jgi:hypothetical protein
MKNVKLSAWAAGLLLTAVTPAAFAQTSSSGQTTSGDQVRTISTAVPFLRISPDARSGAMGDVGVALSPDANATYWNIGKMAMAKKDMGFAVTYTPWLKDLVPDIFLGYISGYKKFGQDGNQAVSASFRYFSLGEINYTDINGGSIGTGRPRELSFDVGYSRKLSNVFSAGISMRYINSNLTTGADLSNSSAVQAAKPGNAVAADLGFFYSKDYEKEEGIANNFSAGLALTNLGSRISYNGTTKDFLPANMGLGAAYTIGIDEYNKMTFAADINKLLVPSPKIDSNGHPYMPTDKSMVSGLFGSFTDAEGGFAEEMRELMFSVGAEYWYQDQFAVRAGYYYENKTKGNRQYFTVGAGVRYNVFGLNVSYLVPSGSGITRNPLSNTFRFSLTFDFDDLKKDS